MKGDLGFAPRLPMESECIDTEPREHSTLDKIADTASMRLPFISEHRLGARAAEPGIFGRTRR